MAIIFGAVLAITIGMVLVAVFVMWLTNNAAGAAVTDRFREAEFILESHQAPSAWAKPRSVFTWLMQNPAGWRNLVQKTDKSTTDTSSTKIRVLQRLDGLIRYFEICPFVEDKETRELLLGKLSRERADWKQRSLDEIIAEEGTLTSI